MTILSFQEFLTLHAQSYAQIKKEESRLFAYLSLYRTFCEKHHLIHNVGDVLMDMPSAQKGRGLLTKKEESLLLISTSS